jgi:hypothetical protein
MSKVSKFYQAFAAGVAKACQLLLIAGVALAVPARMGAQAKLSQADLHCAGFYTHRTIETSLTIQGSEDAGFKNEYGAGDYVYLSKGKDAITGTGGMYTIIRPEVDVNRQEAFPGQRMMLIGLGTYYAEIGSAEVVALHDHSATAKIVTSCDLIEAGDFLVPYNAATAPVYKMPHVTDRFAPSSGKAMGIVAAARDFDQWLGEGKIAYINMGTAQGIQPGSYFRVVRRYRGGDSADYSSMAKQQPTEMNGTPMGKKLTVQEEANLPRETIGEIMILKAEDGSATGIVTFSRSEIAVGDSVELE